MPAVGRLMKIEKTIQNFIRFSGSSRLTFPSFQLVVTVVNKDQPATSVCISLCIQQSKPEAESVADNFGRSIGETVIADCSPSTVVAYLQTSFSGYRTSSDKTYCKQTQKGLNFSLMTR